MTSQNSDRLTGQKNNANTNKNDTLLPDLLRHAQVRETAPEEVKQRIKHQLKVRWQQNINQGKQRKSWFLYGSVATAMSALLLLLVNQVGWQTSAHLTQVALYAVQGKVRQNEHLLNEKQALQSKKSSLTVDTKIATSDDGYATLILPNGGNLRLNHNSTLIVNNDNEFTLTSGAVYFESSATQQKTPITIHTAYGKIQDIGTQFSVFSTPENFQISVREGLVKVQTKQQKLSVKAGVKFTAKTNGKITQTNLNANDQQWQWVNKLAPKFVLEGKSLHQYLVWVAREYGLKLTFDSQHNEKMSRLIIVHGSILNLNLTQALSIVFASTDFNYKLDNNQLSVYKVIE